MEFGLILWFRLGSKILLLLNFSTNPKIRKSSKILSLSPLKFSSSRSGIGNNSYNFPVLILSLFLFSPSLTNFSEFKNQEDYNFSKPQSFLFSFSPSILIFSSLLVRVKSIFCILWNPKIGVISTFSRIFPIPKLYIGKHQ